MRRIARWRCMVMHHFSTSDVLAYSLNRCTSTVRGILQGRKKTWRLFRKIPRIKCVGSMWTCFEHAAKGLVWILGQFLHSPGVRNHPSRLVLCAVLAKAEILKLLLSFHADDGRQSTTAHDPAADEVLSFRSLTAMQLRLRV